MEAAGNASQIYTLRKTGHHHTDKVDERRDFVAVSVGSQYSAYCSIRKLNTPRRLMPCVRVGAMRPITSGGTAVERRVFQQSSTSCIVIVSQATTRLASKLSASATPASHRAIWLVSRPRDRCRSSASRN
jgi:hypothetical protein